MKKLVNIRLSKKQFLIIAIAILSIVSIIVVLLNPAARRGPFGFGSPAPMVTFTIQDNSFSISYPKNWVAMETPQGSHGDIEIVAVIVVSGQAHAGVEIARKSFPDGNINQVIAWGEERTATCPKFSPLPLDPLTDNTNKNILEYTCIYSDLSLLENGESKFRYHDLYVYFLDVGYEISFFSPDARWSDLEDYFKTMEQSFTIRADSIN